MSWWLLGLDNVIGLYDKRIKEPISKAELRRLRDAAKQVPSLETTLKSVSAEVIGVRREFDAYKRSSEESLRNGNSARQNAERESDRLTRLVKRFSQVTRPLFEALGIQAVPTEATDPNVSSLPTLEGELGGMLPYIKLLGDRENRETVQIALSVEEQRRMHTPYAGQEPQDYIANLVRNTNFGNEKSVYTSAELLMKDLRGIFSGRFRETSPFALLEAIAANEGSAKILKATGLKAFDPFFETELTYTKGGSKGLFDAAFNEHLSPHLSNELKARLALARLSALEESEYEQLPSIVLKAQGLIDSKEIKERLKGTFIRTLYAGNARMLDALSSHSILSNTMGEGYTLNDLLSEAANRIPINVKDAKDRLRVYENLRATANSLGLEFSQEDKQALAKGYLVDVLTINDRARFDIAANDPFIQTALTTDGITALIADYVRNQTFPASKDEARFSVGLLVDSEEALQRNLGELTFAKVFERHVKPFDIDQLFWLQGQPIYTRNAKVKEVVDAQFDDKVTLYFKNRYVISKGQEDPLPQILEKIQQVPESARKLVLAGILDTERDAETRIHYVEKVLPHLNQQEAIAMFDAAIKKAYLGSKTDNPWDFRRSFPTPLSLLEERALHFPIADPSALFTEMFTAKEIPPVYAVWALAEIADIAKLRPYLTDETKAVIFGRRIDQVKPKDGFGRREEKDELEELVKEHGHLFPVATVANLLDYYLQHSIDSAREISKGLQTLLDTVKVPRPDLGQAIATAVKNALYDSRKEQPKPLTIYPHHAPVEILMRYKADIPSQDFSDLINLSLRSASLSRNYPEASYQVLKKFDEEKLGTHVQPDVREGIYDIQLRVLNRRLPLLQERDKERFEYNRRMEAIKDFVETEKPWLSPKHFIGVFDIYLRHERLQDANLLLQGANEDLRKDLIEGVVERVNKTEKGAQRALLMETYMRELLSPFMPSDMKGSWEQYIAQSLPRPR